MDEIFFEASMPLATLFPIGAKPLPKPIAEDVSAA
jgi:hypothetical protein